MEYKAIILKKIKSGGGYRCLIRCNYCRKEKWIQYKQIRQKRGKFCSKKCTILAPTTLEQRQRVRKAKLGVPSVLRGKYIKNIDIKLIIQKYQEGMSSEQLAKMFDVTANTIIKRLCANKIKIRKSGPIPGKRHTYQYQKGRIPWNKGKKCPQFSGKNNPMYGKKHSMEALNKMRGNKVKRKRINCLNCKIEFYITPGRIKRNARFCSKKCWYSFSIKENNPNWNNGSSKEPYSFEFTNELKEEIRQRDNHICQKCGKTQEEELKIIKKILAVHHIDYNKQNCEEWNLVVLCCSCNAKANFKRTFWKNFFMNIIKQKFEVRGIMYGTNQCQKS